MQIKLPDDVAKKFAGKSPEDIVALLREWNPEASAAPAPLPPNVVLIDDFRALAAKVDGLASLPDKVAGFEAKLTEACATANKAVTEAVEASTKMVTAAIAKSGLAAPLAAGASATDGGLQPGANNQPSFKFVQLVNDNVAKGMTKAAAISAAMKQDTAAYAEWREKSNGKL